MKKCVKCDIEYDDNIKFCKRCGLKLKKQGNSRISIGKKIGSFLRYFFGIFIILGSITDLFDFEIYGLIGIFAGISLLPITYKSVKTIKKINEKEFYINNSKKIHFFIPFILIMLWITLLPEQELDIIIISDTEQIIAVNEIYEINFETNLSEIVKSDFTFTSSDETIAIVENGIITGLSEGTVYITIKADNGVETTAEYIIEYIEADTITVDCDDLVIVGKKYKLNTAISPDNASDNIISYESSDAGIIKIDNNGNIEALSQGTATITVLLESGKTQKLEITSYIDIESMIVEEKEIRVENGESIDIEVSILPVDATLLEINWTSDDETIATVNQGTVVGVSKGKTTVTATSLNGVILEIDIEVYEIEVSSISIEESDFTLAVGDSKSVNANITPSNATDQQIKWKSSDNSVATVKDGTIVAVNRGEATITASSSNGKEVTINVSVTEESPIKLNEYYWDKDSVCGIEWTLSITNNSDKIINYITIKWFTLNAVEDPIYDSISGKNYVIVKYTGPLNPGENTGKKYNTTKFYNCSYSESRIAYFEIEYSDGSTETIMNEDFNEYTNLN